MVSYVTITAIILACGALAFLLSGMEAGVFALNRLRLRQRMRAGDQRAQLLLDYLEHPEPFLWTILVGSTLANFVLVALLILVLHDQMEGHPLGLVGSFVAVVFLLYALGDLLPKLLFQRIPNRLCLWLARPYHFIHLGLTPVVVLATQLSRWLLRWTGGKTYTGRLFGSREELRQMMQDSAPGLSSEERSMINRVLDLQTVRLSQILTPLDKAATVTTQTPVHQVLAVCRDQGLTRLPVWDAAGPARRIVGIVSLKDLLYREDVDLERLTRDYLKPALYLDEDVRLETALRRMQQSGQRLAIVLRRDRRELGLVSLQDILQTVFGQVSL